MRISRHAVYETLKWIVCPIAVFWWVCALALLSRCASAPEPVATPQKPRVGCILATPTQQSRFGGRLLPETVLVIGTTSMEDGERWKVVRAPDWSVDDWEPHSRDAIHFGARCQSASQSAFDASRREAPKSEREP